MYVPGLAERCANTVGAKLRPSRAGIPVVQPQPKFVVPPETPPTPSPAARAGPAVKAAVVSGEVADVEMAVQDANEEVAAEREPSGPPEVAAEPLAATVADPPNLDAEPAPEKEGKKKKRKEKKNKNRKREEKVVDEEKVEETAVDAEDPHGILQ